MSEGLDVLRSWVKGLARQEAEPPQWVRLPGAGQPPLVPGEDYFRVRIRRVAVAYEREWLEKYAPMLVVATEFSYDGETITRPAVIGPSMIEQAGGPAPLSTTIADTVVAGPHPLRAGGVGVTVALHRVARGNVVGQLFDVVDGTAKALDLVGGITPYTTLARVVVSGITALTGGDRALVARRDQFTPVQPGDFALLSPRTKLDPAALSLVDGELHTLASGVSTPVRGTDYVVYSVERVAPSDVDVTRLGLHRRWLEVLDEANRASTPEIWQSTKVRLSALVSAAFTSPDLTWHHAEELETEWTAKAVSRRDRARRLGDMGGIGELQDARSHALAILEL